jgi:hypothetical protein
MESTIKIGEVETVMIDNVNAKEELKVFLRWGWGAEITGKLEIVPAQDLKVGDGIRIIIEKVIVVPDPVEEKVKEPACAIAENQQATAEIPAKTVANIKPACDLK